MACATESGISPAEFIWVIESKFGFMEKNLLSENKKAEKGQKLKKYQTDFNFS